MDADVLLKMLIASPVVNTEAGTTIVPLVPNSTNLPTSPATRV